MTTNGWGNRIVFFLFLTLLVSFSSAGQSPQSGSLVTSETAALPNSVAASPYPVHSYGHLPLAFDPNVGQTDPQVQFLAHGEGYELFLTRAETVLALQKTDPNRAAYRKLNTHRGKTSSSVLRIRLNESNQSAQLMGASELPGKNNYFIGNDRQKWHTGVPTYAQVKYKDIYPGIDLIFYGDQRNLEWDAVVAPGADPKQLEFHIDGSRKMRIDSQGDLRISTGAGEVKLKKPILYQKQLNDRSHIQGRYSLLAGHTVRFIVGSYDQTKPLIIDPALDYSTYLGGSEADLGDAIAVDSNGDAYVAGNTLSTNFPTTSNAVNPGPPSSNPIGAAFVSEINPGGTSLLYSTYFSGNGGEWAYGIAVDAASPPNVYVTGQTFSTNFPTTPNAYLTNFTPAGTSSPGGGGTCFVTKFNPSVNGLNALVYSSYLGGNGTDLPAGIAIDTNGNMYLTGWTYSTNFPITSSAFQSVNNGAGTLENAFVTSINPSQSGSASLLYSTYLGGTGNQSYPIGDAGLGIAVDSESNAYITGTTSSGNFPTTASAFMETAPSGVTNGTGFVARIDTAASGEASLIYSTFLGGSVSDAGQAISLGPDNLAYITGGTSSSNFPVTSGAFQATAPGGINGSTGVGFFTVIDTTQSDYNSLMYSTFLGGSVGDYARAIAVDSAGNGYIGGRTSSTNFPITTGAYQTTLKGCMNGFVTELMPAGNGTADLIYSTFFDGTENSNPCTIAGVVGIALDSSDNAYITGQTAATNFPVSPSNAYQKTLNGTSDAYIAKLSITPKISTKPSISTLSVTSGILGTAVTISGSNFGMNQGTSTVTFGTVAAEIESWSSSSIVAQVPNEPTPGSAVVAVQTTVGKSNTKAFTVFPNITMLSPVSAPTGATVTIYGSNLGTSGTVKFNGHTATTTSWSDSAIVATVPTGSTTGNVIVISNSVTSAGSPFTLVSPPTITGVSVNSGTSGTTVTISGTNFGLTQAAENGTVVFGGATAHVTSWNSTTINAQVPSGAAPGSGSIIVTASGIDSNSWSFTVNPSLSSFSPNSGPVGQSVIVTGANFGSTQGSGTIQFGTMTAQVTNWGPASITATVPNLSAGPVEVVVTAGSVATNQVWFAVTGASGSSPTAAPVITGTPPFGSFGGGPEQINLANLNMHYAFPVFSKAGRGTSFNYNLQYDSAIWYPAGVPGQQTWQVVNNFGWAGQSNVLLGSVNYVVAQSGTCSVDQKQYTLYYGWAYQDSIGVSHPVNMGGVSSDPNCGSDQQTGSTTDGSGFAVSVSATPNTNPQVFVATVTSRSGRQINPPVGNSTSAGTVTDRNGNQISVNSSGVFTDTLGTVALTVAGSSPNPVTFTYTGPSGAVTVTLNYSPYTLRTNFGCSGIAEAGPTAVNLVSSITYPDGTRYAFTYEPTPGFSGDVTGRIKSVTLPTGGTLSYTYTGGSNGIVCTDGTTATLNRTTPDGSWTYSHSESGTAWTTFMTDPQTNLTTISFQGIYETERQISQGSNILKTIITCYNDNTSNCNSTAVNLPIMHRTVFVQWPGTNGLQSRIDRFYNATGLLTEQDNYGYAAGAPGAIIRKTLTAYANLGNGINTLPASNTVEDASGNIYSQTTFSYDQTAVTTTTGTPQHIAISGSRGNATTITYLVAGSTTLNKIFTYYDTGNVKTAQDVNGAQTSYTFGDCGNSFPTLINEPLSLTRSMIWNCTGAVQSSVKDENNETTTVTFNDQFYWRPNKITDPAEDIENVTYNGATSVETSMLFNNSNSTADSLITVDSLSRTHTSQRKQSPSSSSYDSVESDYDSLGRSSRATLPYNGTAGQLNSSAPGTSTTYDALNRKSQITDSSGRTVTYTYSQNDAYRTLGPAPNGENTKRKQFEHDALGRLTSVCEVTSLSGSGQCGQTSPANGYWTEYFYNPLKLTSVVQNAQPGGTQQTRTYSYDDLGRMTSETNPESGMTQYFYDADPGTVGANCPGTYNGDLVKKYDAVGNTTCFTYDALHRMISTTYSGPYASNTPNKYFVYDAATVNGVAMVRAKSRMAEAFTATCQTCTKLTDIGFSYTVLGQTSDVYEFTPNSAGYYHVTGGYFPNGALKTLSNLVGLPTMTYGVDGEGRIYSASAASGQNPLLNTSYNYASLPTQLNLGSSDSDSFTYDPNSNRMIKYQFNVNSQSVTGSLTWNTIGTLEDLNVSDPFFTGGNQSCSYVHDDLSRIESADCGQVWSQTFTYDPFGNISKTGSAPFQPTYSETTNQITNIGGSTPTYDANGNSTNDTFHTYAWDAAGRAVTIDSVGLTYDALGRMVEQNRGGNYSQIVYGPTGAKLAVMSGQTLQKAFVPLPAGSTAVYNSSGLEYYRHSDWLGSSRFASTTMRTMYFDSAYGPFGEPYAETGTTDLSFTGMNQDTVVGLYDFPAREYGVQGRWPSPDPGGLKSVSIRDPQSWNRYAYVSNNPLTFTDPTGMNKCFSFQHPLPCEAGGGAGLPDSSGSSDDATTFLDYTDIEWDGSLVASQSDTSTSDNNPPDVGSPSFDPDCGAICASTDSVPDTFMPDSVPANLSVVGDPTAVGPSSFILAQQNPTLEWFGAGANINYQVVDQYNAVMSVPGMEPTEVDSFGYSGPVELNADGTPELTNANGQYNDSPVGEVSLFSIDNATFTQKQYVTYQNVSYPVGVVTWTINSSLSSSGPVTITGSNGVSVTYQPGP